MNNEIKICDYGCNQKANFKMRNNKWCCGESHYKCKGFLKRNGEANKGTKRSKGILFNNIQNILCSQNCGKLAKFYFSYSNIYGCEQNHQSCPSFRKKQSNTMTKIVGDNETEAQRRSKIVVEWKNNTIDEKTGFNLHKIIGLKSSKTKNEVIKESGLTEVQEQGLRQSKYMNKIDEKTGLRNADRISKINVEWKNSTIINGLNMHQIIAKKAGKTRKTNIDPETGLTITQLSTRKRIQMQKNTIDPTTGKTLFKLSTERRIAYDDNFVDPETGLNGHKTKAKHATETKRKTIDPKTGLSVLDIQIDRLLKSGVYCSLKMYKNTTIHYQGSYEFKWLEKMEQLYGLEFFNKITQPRINYFDSTTGKIKMYYTDFVIGDTVYEIKSSWTWEKDLQRNKDKIKACLDEGYKVKLIINHEEYNGEDLI